MKILLIYKSETGFTERYAKWISEEIDCKIEKYSNLQNVDFKKYDLIIYGSRIHAGKIDGLSKIKKIKLKNKLVIFATGATPQETDSIKDVWKNNLSEEELQDIKHFYIPAGLNYEKMGFLDKMIMKMFSFMLSRLKNKNDEKISMQDTIKKSYDISDKSRIKPLLDYIRTIIK